MQDTVPVEGTAFEGAEPAPDAPMDSGYTLQLVPHQVIQIPLGHHLGPGVDGQHALPFLTGAGSAVNAPGEGGAARHAEAVLPTRGSGGHGI